MIDDKIPVIPFITWDDPTVPPHCIKCNKIVDYFQSETPVGPQRRSPLPDRYEHTGERIITIKCHGETFKWSNWKGVIPTHDLYLIEYF
jgi:hypothetical protein